MSQRPPAAIVIGCSAGGLNALHVLLGGLSAALPVPVIVVCHSGSEDMRLFCELLQRSSPMPVHEAEERVRPRPGEVHVAPSGYHLLLEQNGCFALSIDDRVEYSRPSINVLFESASNLWKETVIAVLMTGANADGARGLATIRDHGGIAIVEDPRSATVPTMPEMALKLAGADHCLPVGRIAPLLENLCKP